MKKLLYLLVASLSFVMVGCSEDIHESGIVDSFSEQLPELTAGFAEEQTKTYVESGKYLRWHEGDLITAFFGRTLNNKFMFEGKTGDNSGSFAHIPSGKLETGNAIDAIYAVYPYNAESKFIEGGKIKLYLPVEQEYAPESFGKGANTMVAATENTEDTYLAFKNVCGFLKLGFTGSDIIKSIKVQGNNNEQLAGEAYAVPVFAGKPSMEMGDETEGSVTVVCGEGVALKEVATEFWVVLPEVTFEKGITITVTTAEGAKYVKTTGKKIMIERNTVQPMAALSLPSDFCAEGSNIVEYTATAQLQLSSAEYSQTSEFITGNTHTHPVSHIYNAETCKGVIIFDRPVTGIRANAFDETHVKDYSLISMTLPATVTTIEDRAFAHCRKLTRIHLRSSVLPALGNNVFISNAKPLPVHIFVPTSMYEKYSNDNAWSGLAVWPYDYEKCYPDIPDNQIWYTSDSYDTPEVPNSGISSWQITSHEFNTRSNKGIITFSSAISSLPSNSFTGSDIASIILPSRVSQMYWDTFVGCSDLTLVYLPQKGVNAYSISAGNTPFGECESLVEFAGGCTSEDGRCYINKGRVYHFIGTGLSEYSIPDGVTELGMFSFASNGLERIHMPASILEIDVRALGGNNFTEIIIPDSVNTIRSNAFANCSALRTVILGLGVTSIGSNLFDDCTSLESIYFRSLTPPSIDGKFLPTDSAAKIYVPRGSIQAYKLYANLSAYSAQMEEYDM